MKRNKCIVFAFGAVLLAAGIGGFFWTRQTALAEGAGTGITVAFALGIIAAVLGCLLLIRALVPTQRQHTADVRTLTAAALFAALCYIGFTYARIDIPVGGEKTAFHLGNVFCVLAALFLGGFWGGMAGAVGMTLADLTTAYVTSAPKTFLLKLCIGLIVGLVAHKGFHISRDTPRKLPLAAATAISCTAGMAFNMVADPLVGYFYKRFLMGIPQEAAAIWAKMGAVTTAVNAVMAIVAATVFYLALRAPLKRAKLAPEL